MDAFSTDLIYDIDLEIRDILPFAVDVLYSFFGQSARLGQCPDPNLGPLKIEQQADLTAQFGRAAAGEGSSPVDLVRAAVRGVDARDVEPREDEPAHHLVGVRRRAKRRHQAGMAIGCAAAYLNLIQHETPCLKPDTASLKDFF